MTPSEKLQKVQSIVDDTAGWELAANQLQQKLIDILQEEDDPEPSGPYFVAWLDGQYQVLRYRENKVLQFFAKTGDNHGSSRTIARLLNTDAATNSKS